MQSRNGVTDTKKKLMDTKRRRERDGVGDLK